MLEEVDSYFLRSLFKSHSKTSTAFLHLETATWPIKFIIASRRLNFLHNILKRNTNEVLLRVYKAQKESPLKGDFANLIKTDFELIEETYDENFVTSMSKNQFKAFIKRKMSKAVFKYLLEEKEKLSKLENISYNKFKIQKYLKSKLLSDYQVQILSKLRSRNINVKANFKTKFTFNDIPKLECSIDGCDEQENQQHILKCKPLLAKLNTIQKTLVNKIKYEDIYSEVKKQKIVTDLFIALLDIKDDLMKKQNES